jgi:hypothetical protein
MLEVEEKKMGGFSNFNLGTRPDVEKDPSPSRKPNNHASPPEGGGCPEGEPLY